MTAVASPQRQRRTGWRRVGHLPRRALMMEIHGYRSIFRFTFRRPRVTPGAVGFGYTSRCSRS